MRQVTSEELKQWYKDNPQWPSADDKMLDEMDEEGVIFEMQETENGTEYPTFNIDNWEKERQHDRRTEREHI